MDRLSRRPNRRTIKKLLEGRCFFCEEASFELLDSHRIIPGPEGGKYDWGNVLVICSLCHRKIHAGRIRVDRKYLSTAGTMVHFWEDGVEHWKPEAPPRFDKAPSPAPKRRKSSEVERAPLPSRGSGCVRLSV